MTSVLSRVVERFGKWRLAFLVFLLVYAAILLMILDLSPLVWDETPHLTGTLLLTRGKLSPEYLEEYAFYPPLFDITTFLYFTILGPSLISARLVAVTFGLLTICAVFEFTRRYFGPRNALLASVLLASIPGFVILCRLALIETMVLFFFSLSLILFLSWIRTNSNKLLLLTGLALGLGFVAKYQTVFSGVVMLVTTLLMYREHIIKKIGKLFLIAIIAVAVFLPWFAIVHAYYTAGNLEIWMYAVSVGNEERTEYSERFNPVIFYLIEMTYPYSHIHPVSLPFYIVALLGLGFLVWRRREADKFSLLWFFVIYVIFTLIPNKNWRYLILVFPVLAISASELILFMWDKLRTGMKNHKICLDKPILYKAATAVFLILIGSTVVCSWYDAYSWVARENVNIPIDEAAKYVNENSGLDEGVIVLFTGNFFSTDMVRFYLRIYDSYERVVEPYPETPIDTYRPTLNETFLSEYCEELDVTYLLMYEHGNITYYDSDWNSYYVLERLIGSGNFTVEVEFGAYPRRVTVLQFTPNP